MTQLVADADMNSNLVYLETVILQLINTEHQCHTRQSMVVEIITDF